MIIIIVFLWYQNIYKILLQHFDRHTYNKRTNNHHSEIIKIYINFHKISFLPRRKVVRIFVEWFRPPEN